MSDDPIRRLIQDALQSDNPTAWFEPIYQQAAQGEGRIPWARYAPDPQLLGWLADQTAAGRALVIGCGLGDDAEALAHAGYQVTAFDISPTAIAQAQVRFPDSAVDYQVADLFALPSEWISAYDLVVEHRTIQALPWHLTDAAIAAIVSCVAPHGRVVVLTHGRDPEEDRRGIPWPLSRTELAGFLTYGLTETAFLDYREHGLRRFCVVYQR
ncbi:MAG: class I SAM-dependent methyltransferase [Anaerolineae bacterium]|jgi:SAM-dependent methyltransferase|nr:class I SAM-dependent methyltransferase [Anaerolineae bacterium]